MKKLEKFELQFQWTDVYGQEKFENIVCTKRSANKVLNFLNNKYNAIVIWIGNSDYHIYRTWNEYVTKDQVINFFEDMEEFLNF